jgi:hypothetical protein
MSRIVYLDHQSPLSRFHVHKDVLPGNLAVKSVEQAYGVIMARLCKRTSVANKILESGSIYETQPQRIRTLLEVENIGQTGEFVLERINVYLCIWLDQIGRPTSPLRLALQAYVAPDEQDPFFVVCQQGKDRVLSCGMSRRDAMSTMLHLLPGANLYGAVVLENAYKALTGDLSIHPKWDVAQLVTGNVALGPPCKTCFVIGDSMVKFIKHVDGGEIRSISGGTLKGIRDVLYARNDLSQFRVIAIHGGINDLQADRTASKKVKEFQLFRELLLWLRRNCPDTVILVSLPLRHENLSVPQFNQEMRNWLGGINRLQVLEAVHPFWVNGARNMSMYKVHADAYFRADPFHLHQVGTEELWRKMCAEVPMLKHVRINLGVCHFQKDVRPGVRSKERRWEAPPPAAEKVRGAAKNCCFWGSKTRFLGSIFACVILHLFIGMF